jgi:hypothetical protein
MEKQFKKWVLTTIMLSLIVPCCVTGINYFMDPLWCFSISHEYNQKQDDFNERYQKTNFINSRGFAYKGIIVGSSTGTTIQQDALKGMHLFNYSINGLLPSEFLSIIDFAKKKNGHDLDYILIGLDFIAASKLLASTVKSNPEKIFDEINSWLYLPKMLISIDTLKHSINNFMNYQKGTHIYYDRYNNKYVTPLPREVLELHMKVGIRHHDESNYPLLYNTFQYDNNLKLILKEIKAENPGSRIMVFTTPVIAPLMKLLVEKNLLDDYLRWLAEIVDVFGGCYHFMYPNKITKNYISYFHDPTHCYPPVGSMIIDAILNKKIDGISNFGIYIDKATSKHKLAYLKELMKKLRSTNELH